MVRLSFVWRPMARRVEVARYLPSGSLWVDSSTWPHNSIPREGLLTDNQRRLLDAILLYGSPEVDISYIKSKGRTWYYGAYEGWPYQIIDMMAPFTHAGNTWGDDGGWTSRARGVQVRRFNGTYSDSPNAPDYWMVRLTNEEMKTWPPGKIEFEFTVPPGSIYPERVEIQVPKDSGNGNKNHYVHPITVPTETNYRFRPVSVRGERVPPRAIMPYDPSLQQETAVGGNASEWFIAARAEELRNLCYAILTLQDTSPYITEFWERDRAAYKDVLEPLEATVANIQQAEYDMKINEPKGPGIFTRNNGYFNREGELCVPMGAPQHFIALVGLRPSPHSWPSDFDPGLDGRRFWENYRSNLYAHLGEADPEALPFYVAQGRYLSPRPLYREYLPSGDFVTGVGILSSTPDSAVTRDLVMPTGIRRKLTISVELHRFDGSVEHFSPAQAAPYLDVGYSYAIRSQVNEDALRGCLPPVTPIPEAPGTYYFWVMAEPFLGIDALGRDIRIGFTRGGTDEHAEIETNVLEDIDYTLVIEESRHFAAYTFHSEETQDLLDVNKPPLSLEVRGLPEPLVGRWEPLGATFVIETSLMVEEEIPITFIVRGADPKEQKFPVMLTMDGEEDFFVTGAIEPEYTISNLEELEFFIQKGYFGTWQVIADIDGRGARIDTLASPVIINPEQGPQYMSRTSSLIGNGHTISNITFFNSESANDVAIIHEGEGSVVSDLTLDNCALIGDGGQTSFFRLQDRSKFGEVLRNSSVSGVTFNNCRSIGEDTFYPITLTGNALPDGQVPAGPLIKDIVVNAPRHSGSRFSAVEVAFYGNLGPRPMVDRVIVDDYTPTQKCEASVVSGYLEEATIRGIQLQVVVGNVIPEIICLASVYSRNLISDGFLSIKNAAGNPLVPIGQEEISLVRAGSYGPPPIKNMHALVYTQQLPAAFPFDAGGVVGQDITLPNDINPWQVEDIPGVKNVPLMEMWKRETFPNYDFSYWSIDEDISVPTLSVAEEVSADVLLFITATPDEAIDLEDPPPGTLRAGRIGYLRILVGLEDSEEYTEVTPEAKISLGEPTIVSAHQDKAPTEYLSYDFETFSLLGFFDGTVPITVSYPGYALKETLTVEGPIASTFEHSDAYYGMYSTATLTYMYPDGSAEVVPILSARATPLNGSCSIQDATFQALHKEKVTMQLKYYALEETVEIMVLELPAPVIMDVDSSSATLYIFFQTFFGVMGRLDYAIQVRDKHDESFELIYDTINQPEAFRVSNDAGATWHAGDASLEVSGEIGQLFCARVPVGPKVELLVSTAFAPKIEQAPPSEEIDQTWPWETGETYSLELEELRTYWYEIKEVPTGADLQLIGSRGPGQFALDVFISKGGEYVRISEYGPPGSFMAWFSSPDPTIYVRMAPESPDEGWKWPGILMTAR